MTTEVLDQTDLSCLTWPELLDQAEAELLALPQVDLPVHHHFAPGLYVREVTFPKGMLIIGHAHRKEHMNLVLTGAMALNIGGRVEVVTAPAIFMGGPGRKVGIPLENCTWVNVFATDERDIEKLENEIVEKSPAWRAYEANKQGGMPL